MKTEDGNQAQKARISEGMRLIFDQETNSSRSSSRSSSRDSSYSSNQSSCSSYGSHGSRRRHRRHRRRSRSSPSSSSSSSSSSSDSDSRSRSRSRSHPRCHRASDRSRCYHHHQRRYRARSRSRSRSPYRHREYRHRAYSRSSSRSSSRGRYSKRWRRSRSRSSSHRRVGGMFVGRYRCRFSPSPRRRYRDYRSRSRSPERSSVRLSRKEKMNLLNIAKENAARLLGVQNLELPKSVKPLEEQERKPERKPEERVRAEPETLTRPEQVQDVANEDDKEAVKMSPTRKPINFSINNTVAKPSSSPTFHVAESKVTSRADSVGNRKPYGQWVPIKKSSPNKH